MFTRSAILAALLAPTAAGQFDPLNGEWGKEQPTDLRVMTWNILDGIASSEVKNVANDNWAAIVRIVAAMQPDVLVLQEVGDGDGVGTLQTTFDLFFDGGPDPFRGGQVTEYVTKYAPDYRPEYVYVSTTGDGFNRNVIVSRYPFIDLNGDGNPTTATFSTAQGNSGIRGIQFAEINLPDETYLGDVVVSNAHLKAFGDADSRQQRIDAANGMASYLWNFYNGAGTSTPDPNNQVNDFRFPTSVLDENTPIIWGGDYNEDEATNGRNGPVLVSTTGPITGGTSDGTDADGTDASFDSAREPFTNSRATQSSSKLDWLMWQDSKTTPRNQFIFRSDSVPAAQIPQELIGFGTFVQDGRAASAVASDHRPVIVDFVLPLGVADNDPGEFSLLTPADGEVNVQQFPLLSWSPSEEADTYTITIANDPGLTDVVFAQALLPNPLAVFPSLEECQRYYWSVEAVNQFGSTVSSPAVATFKAFARADQNGDGNVNGLDFGAWLGNFNDGNPAADVNGDGTINGLDFGAWLGAFNQDCDS